MTSPDALDLLAPATTSLPPVNTDPHPVVLRMDPRFTTEDGIEHEAYLYVEVDHPATCPGDPAACPVQDYLDVIGPDREFTGGFPEPDFLSDTDLAALDGTVRFVTVTRTCQTHSNGPGGIEYDAFYDFTWSDQ